MSSTTVISANHDLVRRLMRAIESGAHGEQLRGYFHPEVEQVEYPSLVDPRVGRRGPEELLAASTTGIGLLVGQRYEERRVVEAGDDLVMQLEWHAELAVPLGSLPAGARLHTYSVLSFGFDGGRIRRMEAYDCYDPLPAV